MEFPLSLSRHSFQLLLLYLEIACLVQNFPFSFFLLNSLFLLAVAVCPSVFLYDEAFPHLDLERDTERGKRARIPLILALLWLVVLAVFFPTKYNQEWNLFRARTTSMKRTQKRKRKVFREVSENWPIKKQQQQKQEHLPGEESSRVGDSDKKRKVFFKEDLSLTGMYRCAETS